MYCRKCGKEIPDRQSFCPYCGADQRKDTQSFTTMIDIKEMKKNKTTKTRKHVFSFYAIFSFIVSLLALFFDAFVFINIFPFCVVGGVLTIISLILAIIGVNETKHNVKNGGTFAVSSIALDVISAVFLVVFVFLFVFYK